MSPGDADPPKTRRGGYRICVTDRLEGLALALEGSRLRLDGRRSPLSAAIDSNYGCDETASWVQEGLS
jgi:hypothetical protein